jgi:hypothetical protein
MTEDGHAIKGVRRAVITLHPREAIAVDLEMEVFASFHGNAQGRLMVMDPLTGEPKECSRIEFADGTSWAAK